jgi:hypothetical protein
MTLPAPSSRFPFMVVEAAQIRNVAFEIIATDTAVEPQEASAGSSLAGSGG